MVIAAFLAQQRQHTSLVPATNKTEAAECKDIAKFVHSCTVCCTACLM